MASPAADVQTISGLTIAGPATLTVQPSNFRIATLSIGNDVTAGRITGSSLLIRGNSLGGTITTAHAKVQGTFTLSNGTGSGPTVGILPYAIGDTTNAGSGMGLVTYDATYGVRLLYSSEYTGNIAAATPSNVSLATGTSTSTVTQHSLTLAGSSAVALTISSGTLTLDAGALVSAGTAAAANTITGAGSLALTSTTDPHEGFIHTIKDLTINSVIQNYGSDMLHESGLVKDGPGTLTLTASNTYSFTTTVNAGTLNLANPNGSAKTIAGGLVLNGGTLTTTGSLQTIGGGIAAGFGPNTISPGGDGSIGSISLGSSLTLNSNSTLKFDITSTSSLDQILDSGALSFSGNGQATIAVAGSPGPGVYDLINFNSTAVGDITNVSNLLCAAGSLTLDAGSGNTMQLDLHVGSMGPQFMGVPEPSTLALLAAGVIGLLMYAWRKRK